MKQRFDKMKREHQAQMKVEQPQHENKDWEYNARKRANQERIDEILDKIRRSGYDSLTKEEKRELFDSTKE